MEQACTIVEQVVNDELRKRRRFPLEWDGLDTEGKVWRANVAASNCYEGAKESVGYVSLATFDFADPVINLVIAL